jgi:hypothetical protein
MKEKLKAFLDKLNKQSDPLSEEVNPRSREVMNKMLDDSPLQDDEYYYEPGESEEDNIPREVHAERKAKIQERRMADWRKMDKEYKNKPSFKKLMQKMGISKEEE